MKSLIFLSQFRIVLVVFCLIGSSAYASASMGALGIIADVNSLADKNYLTQWSFIENVPATSYISSASGSWNDPATWGGAGVPGPNDDVLISRGTTVTLDTDRSSHNLTTQSSLFATPSGILELNGHDFTLNGDGAVFTLEGEVRNSTATFISVNFVGNGTPGGITQNLKSNNGCSSSTPCNFQLHLINGVSVNNVQEPAPVGSQLINIGITVDAQSALDLTGGLSFWGTNQNTRFISNSGTIRNGRLTTERLVWIVNSGVFDSELVVNSTTTRFDGGDLKRLVGIQSTAKLFLGGPTNFYGDFFINSGANFEVNGQSIEFRGSNTLFVNQGGIMNGGGSATISFVGNGTPGSITQHLASSIQFPIANNIITRCTNNVSLLLDQDSQLPNMTVDNGSTFNLAAHTLVMTGPGVTFNILGTIVTTGSVIEMGGSAPQSVQTNLNGAAYSTLKINNPSGVDIPNPGSNPLTIAGTLTLQSGTFTPNGNLNMASGSTIERRQGSLASAPQFGASVNLLYSGFGSIAAGFEIPSADDINNFTNNQTGTVTISSNLTVNGNFAVSSSSTITGPGNGLLTAKGQNVSNAGTVNYPSVVFAPTTTQSMASTGQWNSTSIVATGPGTITLSFGSTFANSLI